MRFFGGRKQKKDVAGLSGTVDGRDPKQPPGMYKNLVNSGRNYQPQLVSQISSINSMLYCMDCRYVQEV